MNNKKLIKKLPKITEDLLEKMALKIVRTGVNKTNFKILDMLPSDINTMMKELNLTKVPVNSRMNQLEKVGLAKRWRGTGRIVLTDLGECFMDMIETGEEMTRGQIEEIIKRLI